jgi:hypothetical protein
MDALIVRIGQQNQNERAKETTDRSLNAAVI